MLIAQITTLYVNKSVNLPSGSIIKLPFFLSFINIFIMQSLQEFVNYVWDFYKPHSDLYPIRGLVKQDIWDALVTYKKRIDIKNVYYNHYSCGDVDSLDR